MKKKASSKLSDGVHSASSPVAGVHFLAASSARRRGTNAGGILSRWRCLEQAKRKCRRDKCQSAYYKNGAGAGYAADKRKGSVAYTLFPRKMSVDQAGNDRVLLPSVIGHFNKTSSTGPLTLSQIRTIIRKELFLYGPTTLALPLTEEFLHYDSGVFHPFPREHFDDRIIYWHVVRLIGWGHAEDGQLFWVAANSFGEQWGENGSVAYTLFPRKMSVDQAGNDRVLLPSVIGHFNKTSSTGPLTLSQIRTIIRKELFLYGPTTLALPLTEEFLHYDSGVFHPFPREHFDDRIIYWHVVRLIGWGHAEDGQLFWVAANSFGEQWGENGLFRVDTTLLEDYGLEYEAAMP
uniref:Pept_C1 domain-containing protein n=1 Tax=Globodera pallida TaxID=36090 RepID=A0A183CGC7_GLOPA